MSKITFPGNLNLSVTGFKSIVKFLLLIFIVGNTAKSTAQDTFTVFDEVLFYDGYAETVDEPVPEGTLRLSNSCYTRKLGADELAAFGNILTMDITIKAACDNYDRIGSVNLALVPTGQESYTYNEVQRIELGRYITPFMDKNDQPDEVPYSFTIDNVAQIFKNETILADYDIWIELELFGVPYAANNEIAGCNGRNDVFYGTLEFVTDVDTTVEYADNFLLPLSFKYLLRDYTLDGTDILGETMRTITFTLEEDVPNAKLHLITSNHGANSGGEEYIRRWHYVYFDNEEVLSYKPGGISCEPFRIYNTQGNGIYGPSPRTDAEWASFSNWCPGDKIPIRVIELGNLAAGEHSFKIDVPDAVFNGDQGEFPMSVYLQGFSETLATQSSVKTNFSLTPNPVTDILNIDVQETEVVNVTITAITGQTVFESQSSVLNLSQLQSGIYIIKIQFNNNQTTVKKIVKK
ncbi:T9SS type A sorting domain-containing protein [Flavobacterium salilacus subsp. salilacus]|uniref:peptide-N-glycosidase F-related protein n=1 Tax=Flavobacterium TaxID=237 RepID=UPI001074C6B5|nr:MULTISPECIES: peptide-N-glycosidase F-related protein [Flavobacterium]KAF2515437.1 T9SS type A sorting domain-containing protein [Flavobacterium salilacus subsp. salilacus]MBE1615832.1 T9SS type A sorting domain-containing protein [Flavobacterium sp. SaA2.13]